MSALERINNAYLELLSAADFGETSGEKVAADLRENSELWSKVYVSDETTEHWMELMHQDYFQCQALYLLAPTDGILNLMSLANTWDPVCMTTRKTAYEVPYHSLIILFKNE